MDELTNENVKITFEEYYQNVGPSGSLIQTGIFMFLNITTEHAFLLSVRKDKEKKLRAHKTGNFNFFI